MEANKPQDTLKIAELTRPTADHRSSADLFLNSQSSSATDIKNLTHTEPNIESNNTRQTSEPTLPNTTATTTPAMANLITTNNLLLTSAGALDLNQISTLASAQYNSVTNGHFPPTATDPSSPALLQLDHSAAEPAPDARFTVIDAVNVCVAVVAYATHALRANQMLIVLDAILPRYLNHIKSETEARPAQAGRQHMGRNFSNTSQEISLKARAELIYIQRAACALKTLVNTSDLLARVYTGPKTGEQQQQQKESFKEANGRYQQAGGVSMVQPDDDSMRFSEDMAKPSMGAGGYNKVSSGSRIDEKQMRAEFRSPRDLLLNILAEFVHFASARIKELYKLVNDPGLKVSDAEDVG